jgi:hypothetical protein
MLVFSLVLCFLHFNFLFTVALSFCTFIFAFCLDLFGAMTPPLCRCDADEVSRSNLVEGHGIATHLSGARNDW